MCAEQIPPARYGFYNLLGTIVQGTSQFNGALYQRIVGYERVRPHSLDQLLLSDEPSRMFNEITERFIDLRTKLNLLLTPEHAAACDIEGEFAELIGRTTWFHGQSWTREN